MTLVAVYIRGCIEDGRELPATGPRCIGGAWRKSIDLNGIASGQWLAVAVVEHPPYPPVVLDLAAVDNAITFGHISVSRGATTRSSFRNVLNAGVQRPCGTDWIPWFCMQKGRRTYRWSVYWESTAARIFRSFYRATLCQRGVLSCCVCLSVSLSQAGIVPKWLNVGSRKQRHTITQGLRLSEAKNIGEIPKRSTPTGVPNTDGVGFRQIFYQ